MKKKIIYFCAGVLLTSLILVAIRAFATAPNPGHALSCHKVIGTYSNGSTVTCDYGTRTGGGCNINEDIVMYGSKPTDDNGWYCESVSGEPRAWVVCCEVGV